jgi:hypothetical protein
MLTTLDYLFFEQGNTAWVGDLARLAFLRMSTQSSWGYRCTGPDSSTPFQHATLPCPVCSLQVARAAPFVEKLVAKGYEVLFLTDAIDEATVTNLQKFGDRELVDVSKEGLNVGPVHDHSCLHNHPSPTHLMYARASPQPKLAQRLCCCWLALPSARAPKQPPLHACATDCPHPVSPAA